MTTEPSKTVPPKTKVRINVGPHNGITHLPCYTYDIDASPMMASLVTANDYLMGGGGEGSTFMIDVDNRSGLAVFVNIFKDGVKMTSDELGRHK